MVGTGVTRRSTGRQPSFVGGVLRIVEHYWIWYRRNWRATAVSSVLQPLLFLLAFGVGFGSLVDGTGRAAEATGGVDYLVWLAPALLAVSAVQSADLRVHLPGAVRVQVAAGLPRDDRRADLARPRSRSPT